MKLLITGKPGSGKTTLLKRLATKLGERMGGMITGEIREQGKRVGFYIEDLSSGKRKTFAHIDFPKDYRVGKYGVDIKVLEEIGVNSIRHALEHKEFVLIDEIGPMELYSQAFIDAVEAAFSSDKNVVATIHFKSQHPLVKRLKGMSGVELFTITQENREDIFNEIVDIVFKCQ